jgi:hypothetical protein
MVRPVSAASDANSNAIHTSVDSVAILVFFQGDGNIDSQEFKLRGEMQDMEVHCEDEDGDGIIDSEEISRARQKAGRTIMAKQFVRDSDFWRNDPDFRHKSEEEMVVDICSVPSKYFRSNLDKLRVRQQTHKIKGSQNIADVMEYQMSDRKATGRLVGLSHSKCADISYHKPSSCHGLVTMRTRTDLEDRLIGRTRRANAKATQRGQLTGRPDASGISGMTQREKRKDILFSARNDAKYGHNRNKGDIKGYGSFSQYAGVVISNYGSMKPS